MAVNIHNLIAAISPDIHCDPKLKDEVKEIAKKDGYLKAAEKAKPKDPEYIDFDKAELTSPFKYPGLKAPIEKHSLSYDAFGEALEPLYYWILDYVNGAYGSSVKFVDNFVSTPGSGHFSEMGQKATRMQEEGMKMLGAANNVVKSILNLIYDLKEFELRLQLYDKIKSGNKDEQASAKISLKQLWMDTVDAKRGNTSLKGLAFSQGSQFVTLIDGFMAAEDESLKYKGGELDLNERIKRIVQQKILEYNLWTKESEKELRKRYEIEKIYLKSQVNSVRLYARWAKPYLRAAKQLEQQMPSASLASSLVTSFNTTVSELVILGEGRFKVDDLVDQGSLDKLFKNIKKEFKPIIIIELQYRARPERNQQGGYGFTGKLEVTFTGYGLAADEIAVLKKEMEKDDLGDVLAQIEGATEAGLGQLKEDLDKFLEEKDAQKEEKKKEEKKSGEDNPFSALFSIFKSEKKKEEKKKDGEISKDTDYEKAVRSFAILEARRSCAKLYDTYKKAHNMPTI